MPLKLLSRSFKRNRQPEQQVSTPAVPEKRKREYHCRPRWDVRDFEPAPEIRLCEDPLEQCIQLERFGTILTHPKRCQDHPKGRQIFSQAHQAVDDQFALVPEGYVSLPRTVNDFPGCPELSFETQPFLLARCAVTNEQYQKFVDGGGYSNLDYWPKDIWPHLIDFVDLTGQPAPRFWRNGRHDRRFSDHPVVGICHYEAAAFARWAGYRLPSEAEWQMAASWRIRSSAQVLRRYCWGDAMDTQRCNVFSSFIGHTVPVDSYPGGAAPNGVLQLIGNVWEWTNSDFEIQDDEGRIVVGDMVMKSIRGGAFDTYFAVQTTSFFRTGLAGLMRTHNVGFRCAMDIIKRNEGGSSS